MVIYHQQIAKTFYSIFIAFDVVSALVFVSAFVVIFAFLFGLISCITSNDIDNIALSAFVLLR